MLVRRHFYIETAPWSWVLQVFGEFLVYDYDERIGAPMGGRESLSVKDTQ